MMRLMTNSIFFLLFVSFDYLQKKMTTKLSTKYQKTKRQQCPDKQKLFDFHINLMIV